MNDIKIKICGLRREEDIRIVNELKPDYIGFVFYEKSKRYVTEEQAAILRAKLSEDIISVGVFVDADIELVARLLRRGIISVAQLHGHETERYIRDLKKNVESFSDNAQIIKAIIVKEEADIRKASETSADYLLFDKGLGSGETFDWDMAQKLLKNYPKPYFLAGGLDESNVKEAIDRLQPYAVDISSKVETDGFKDREKIKAFIDAVRR